MLATPSTRAHMTSSAVSIALTASKGGTRDSCPWHGGENNSEEHLVKYWSDVIQRRSLVRRVHHRVRVAVGAVVLRPIQGGGPDPVAVGLGGGNSRYSLSRVCLLQFVFLLFVFIPFILAHVWSDCFLVYSNVSSYWFLMLKKLRASFIYGK